MVNTIFFVFCVLRAASGSGTSECSKPSGGKPTCPGAGDEITLLQGRTHVAHESDGDSIRMSEDLQSSKSLELLAPSRGQGGSIPLEDTMMVSDPFADVPLHLVRDTARAVAKGQGPSSKRRTPTLLIDRVGEGAETWSDDALRRALTSVQCKGSEHNRSCAFKNLYFSQEDGGFFVFSLNDTEHPDFNSVLLLHKWQPKGQIKRRNFNSLAELREFMGAHRPTVHEGLSLVYDSVFHFNIGHALWDGLYPAFLALCEFGRHGEKFRSVVKFWDSCPQQSQSTGNGKCMSEGVFRKFGGGDMLQYPLLNSTGWHCFADSVAGSGHKGLRSINRDYALPGGRTLDGARRFRDRMYTSHGLQVPRAHTSSWEGRAPAFRGIIIDNKRFKPAEVELLKAVANHLSSTGESRLEYINYGALSLSGNFTQQLKLIGSVSLHVSGPGTAMSYGPFLADGSVHVNLGDRRSKFLVNRTHDRFVSFMEEVWSEGVPYIRALYYDPLRRQPTDYQWPELVSLLHRATDLAQSHFKVPVNPGDNLSPIGRVFTEYCAVSGAGGDDLISLLNGYKTSGFSGVPDIVWCDVNAWAEQIVFEIGGWSEAGQEDEGKTVHCPLDRKILRQVRSRHLGW